MVIIVTILALGGALMNRIRGGLWASTGQTLAGLGAPLCAIYFAFACGIVTHNPYLALLAGIGFFFGEKPSWGEEIGEILRGKFLKGVLQLSFRGIIWTLPIGLGVSYWDILTGIIIALSGISMGVVYGATSTAYRLIKRENHTIEWELSEIVWGFVMFFAILSILNLGL